MGRVRNRLSDLNDLLFAQLERLTDEALASDKIEGEIKRSQAVVQVADAIVENARLQLDAAKLIASNGGDMRKQLPATLGLPAAVQP